MKPLLAGMGSLVKIYKFVWQACKMHHLPISGLPELTTARKQSKSSTLAGNFEVTDKFLFITSEIIMSELFKDNHSKFYLFKLHLL